MEDNKCASMDYEKAYERVMKELEKALCEANYLREELKQKEIEMNWHYGFKTAVEMIFGGRNHE